MRSITSIAQKAAYHLRCQFTNLGVQMGLRLEDLYPRPISRILLYHGIDKVNRTDLNARFLGVDKFRSHLRYFRKHYHLVSLDELQTITAPQSKACLAITFDDGYRNNHELAAPILDEFNIPATFFVTAIDDLPYPMLWADYLDLANHLCRYPISINEEAFHWRKGEYRTRQGVSLKHFCKINDWSFKRQLYEVFPDLHRKTEALDLATYWQPMNGQQIKDLSDHPLFEVGVHAYYHEDLHTVSPTTALELLQKAKHYVEGCCQREVDKLAYANGSYTRPLISKVAELGFKHQYAVDYRHQEDQMDQRITSRLTVNPFVSTANQVRAIMTNRY